MEKLLLILLTTFLGAFITLIGWVGNMFNSRLKELTTSINGMKNLLGAIKGKSMVLEADIEVINEKVKDHETRIREVEKTQDMCRTCNELK